MKNEIRLRASGPLVRDRRRTFDGSRERIRDDAQLDVFTASGLRGVSPFRALAVLWGRSRDRDQLARSLGERY